MNTTTTTRFPSYEEILQLSDWPEFFHDHAFTRYYGPDPYAPEDIFEAHVSSNLTNNSSGSSNPPPPDENTVLSYSRGEEGQRAWKRRRTRASSERRLLDIVEEKVDILLSMTPFRGEMGLTEKLDKVIEYFRDKQEETELDEYKKNMRIMKGIYNGEYPLSTTKNSVAEICDRIPPNHKLYQGGRLYINPQPENPDGTA